MNAQVKVKCSRCAGTGQAVHRTARHDARCFCCNGAGFYYRRPAQKRPTEQERLDAFNARLAELYPQT
jgi:DnaJ-class molecular chaperone